MKRLILLLLLLLTATATYGQTTTVTGTIVDGNGNPYSNGTSSAQKSVATGQVQPPPVNVTTNGSGTFSMTLPSPASYTFTICAPPTQIGPTGNPTPIAVCFSNVTPIVISGVSLDVSSNLNAVAKVLGPNITGVSGVVSVGVSGQMAVYAANGNVVTGALPTCPANQVMVQVGATAGCASLTTSYLPLSGTWAFGGTISGNANIIGTFTFTNHNALCWAGPGATPTIDQAIASCGANGSTGPTVVEISPLYTGPESTQVVTESNGYPIFEGPNNVTVKDMRARGTFGVAIYPIHYGGRIAGQLNRVGVNNFAVSPTDSVTGVTSFMGVRGTFPSNGGLLAGAINVMYTVGAVTVGSSLSELNGTDSEMSPGATSSDNPIGSMSAYGGGVNISRTGVNQAVLEANVYTAKDCSNASPVTAPIYYCYGFNAHNISGGAYRNFAFRNQGNFLSENGANFWVVDVGSPSTISTATETNQTVTFTMAAPCAYPAGQFVTIAGVADNFYNTSYTILAPGCSGSTFSVFKAGTLNHASSSGGTATPGTPRQVLGFSSGNLIVNQPLSDTQGWLWENQAGNSQLFTITSTAITSNISHRFATDIRPSTAGTQSLGNTGFWWGGVSVGANATAATTWAPTTTVNRTLTSPDGNSSTVMPASLVTTAAASDNVAITGMTASGHCTFSATNASAATNIATTFISAKVANQITVSHAVTANMNYDILCTPN